MKITIDIPDGIDEVTIRTPQHSEVKGDNYEILATKKTPFGGFMTKKITLPREFLLGVLYKVLKVIFKEFFDKILNPKKDDREEI